MTRFPHDQFAKNYLKELLAPLGDVQAPRTVAGEVREIDVYFAPKLQSAAESQVLGLLGRLAASPCLLEPFRNAPTPTEIRNCLLKLFELHGELQRQAKRNEQRLQESDLPRLWILSPTASSSLLEGFRAISEDNWMKGVYFLGDHLRTALVAIHQLPRTTDTLWLRILGKGTVQKQAINELAALPADYPFRPNVLLLLLNLQANLQTSEDLDDQERELIMELSPLVVQWREEALREGRQRGIQEGRQEGIQEGRQEGRQEGERIVVENLLKTRFGEIDQELSSVIETLLELPPEEFTPLLVSLEREELLNRFR